MNEYLLNVETDCYGPYPTEEQARYAQFLFVHKHPDLAAWCSISEIASSADYVGLISPQLLH